MQFHLILPGLLWPEQVLRDTAFDLPLPHLSWLLGRSRLRWHDPLPLEDWLCREFGCGEQPPPAAALRLLGDGIDPGNDIWLCADPVHLHFAQGRPSLSSATLDISAAEMQQLTAALAPHFAALGEFRSGAPGHGYLKLRSLPQLRTPPPSAAIGRGNLLPSGADAAHWLRFGNTAQMLLHALPLNAQREAEGRPTLNSLWFWGAGTLPSHPTPAARNYPSIIGDQPLLSGLATWAGITHHREHANLSTLLRNRTAAQLLLDDLQAPTQQLDANAWREALVAIERDWFQALSAALRSGQLASLRVTALGDEACLDLTLSRVDAMKFWRRPRRLHELTVPATTLP